MATVRLLKNGVEAFPAMFTAMDRAVLSISLEMYFFADDDTGREFRDRLVQAAGRGVRVLVLVDSWGSWSLSDSFWDPLRAAGGRVRWFHPFRRGLLPFRNHRKVLLIDDAVAFLGGMNVANHYYQGGSDDPPWRDNLIEIAGPEVVRLAGSFAHMWQIADSPFISLVHRLRRIGRRRRGDGNSVLFLESGPDNPLHPVRRAYHEVIENAVTGIDLAMGYFYPHGRMIRTLKRAVGRGVRVRLMVPLHTDVPIARWAAHGLYGRLLRAGIEVWEYEPAMMHAKLVVADDVMITGSANLDIRSGRINYEIVAVVADAALAARARADFREDLSRSVRISYAEWKNRPLIQKIKERISFWLLARADLYVSRAALKERRVARPRQDSDGMDSGML